MIIHKILQTLLHKNGQDMAPNTNTPLLTLSVIFSLALCVCMFHSEGDFIEDCWLILILLGPLLLALLIGHFRLLSHNMKMERLQLENPLYTRRTEDLPEEKLQHDNDEFLINLQTALTDRKNGGDEQ